MMRWVGIGIVIGLAAACGGETESSEDASTRLDTGGQVDTPAVDIGADVPGTPLTLTIEPSEPRTGDDLRATVGPAELSSAGITFEWSKDGEVQILDGSVIPSAVTARDEVWSVTIRTDDPTVSPSTLTASVTILNSAPTCSAAAISPSSGSISTAFTCACTDWEDADGDEATDECVFFAGAAALTTSGCELPGGSVSGGTSLRCEVTKTDLTASSEAQSSPAVLVTGGPPTAPTSVVLLPVTANAKSILECKAVLGSDPDGGTVTPSTQWIVGNYVNPGTTTTQVQAGSLQSADGVLAKKGDVIRCRVQTVSGDEISEAVDSNEVTLENAAPSGGAVVITPATATKTSVLTCSASDATDPDLDAIEWMYGWTINDQQVVDATTDMLDGDAFSAGDVVRCTATPSDSELFGAPVDSKNTVTILDTPVTVASVTLSPETGDQSTTFTCNWEGLSDPDTPDTVGVKIAWLAGETGDTKIPGAGDGATFTPNGVSGAIRCEVTPYSGSPDPFLKLGAPVTSAPSFVEAGPTLTAPTVGMSAPFGADGTIYCNIATPSTGSSDISYSYTWTVGGGAPFEGAATLGETEVVACQKVTCQATAHSGGTTAQSNIASTASLPGAECNSDSVCSNAVCNETTQQCEVENLSVDPTPCTSGCPSAQTCFEGWGSQNGKCPAPIITSSYIDTGCFNTWGWFIEGENFQFLQDNTGIADYGPKTLGPKGNHQHWNLLTTTKLCVTIGQGSIAGYVGKEVALRNPDGKTSNCVIIENHL